MARKTISWWKAALFGALLLAIGAASIYAIWRHRQRMHTRVLVDATTELIALIAIGVVVLAVLAYRYRANRVAERRLAEMSASEARPAPREERPMRRRGERPTPVGSSEGGPFRGAPAATVQVVRTERAQAQPEVVPGDGDDRGPSILR